MGLVNAEHENYGALIADWATEKGPGRIMRMLKTKLQITKVINTQYNDGERNLMWAANPTSWAPLISGRRWRVAYE